MQYLTPIKGLKNVFAPLLLAKLLLHKRSRGEEGAGIRRGRGWLLEPMLEGSAGPGPQGTALTAGRVFADLFFKEQFYSFFSSEFIPEGLTLHPTCSGGQSRGPAEGGRHCRLIMARGTPVVIIRVGKRFRSPRLPRRGRHPAVPEGCGSGHPLEVNEGLLGAARCWLFFPPPAEAAWWGTKAGSWGAAPRPASGSRCS